MAAVPEDRRITELRRLRASEALVRLADYFGYDVAIEAQDHAQDHAPDEAQAQGIQP